jgi:ATP-dependent RNA helicase DeaD
VTPSAVEPAAAKPETKVEPVLKKEPRADLENRSAPKPEVNVEKVVPIKPFVPNPGPFSRPVSAEGSVKGKPSSMQERPVRHETPPRNGPFGERRERIESPKPSSPKHSRRTPDDQVRLYMNVGSEMGVTPGDVVGAILGETGLPSKTVGTVDIRERHVFVDVAAPHANAIIAKLNRATIRNHKVKVKLA